jgi:hypothetical protein
MVEKTGEIDLRIGGRLFLVRDVSYSPAVSLHLYNKIDSGDYVEQAINIPVLYGAHGAEGQESTLDNP